MADLHVITQIVQTVSDHILEQGKSWNHNNSNINNKQTGTMKQEAQFLRFIDKVKFTAREPRLRDNYITICLGKMN